MVVYLVYLNPVEKRPNFLTSSLEDDLKRRFIETLFWSAYTQITIHGQQDLVQYDVLWDHLLGSENIREDHTVSSKSLEYVFVVPLLIT